MTTNFDPVTVTLASPIEHDGKTFATLTFREAELGDLCAGDHFDGQLQKTAALLAGMAQVSLPVIKRLKARDLATITDKVGHLMGNDIPSMTGAT